MTVRLAHFVRDPKNLAERYVVCDRTGRPLVELPLRREDVEPELLAYDERASAEKACERARFSGFKDAMIHDKEDG